MGIFLPDENSHLKGGVAGLKLGMKDYSKCVMLKMYALKIGEGHLWSNEQLCHLKVYKPGWYGFFNNLQRIELLGNFGRILQSQIAIWSDWHLSSLSNLARYIYISQLFPAVEGFINSLSKKGKDLFIEFQWFIYLYSFGVLLFALHGVLQHLGFYLIY